MSTAVTTVEDLRDRAIVLAVLARLAGPGVEAWGDPSALVELRDRLDQPDLIGIVEHLLQQLPYDTDRLRGQWTHWFDQGRIPPYECSNRVQGAAGHTGPLADIAGFYRAFGMRVHDERPDHLVAELEFLALVTALEADASARGNDEEREVSAGAARTFLRDHLGGWVDAWAARVTATVDDGPWPGLAVLVSEVVAAECRRRRVIPLETAAAFAADPPELDGVAPAPMCGADVEPG